MIPGTSMGNPKVDRVHRRQILLRRVRNIRRRLANGKKLKAVLHRKLAEYESQLRVMS